MKKLAIFLAIMLIPFSAFALDTISDNDLNNVTGQAGVSIYTNSIQIVKTGVTTTYVDTSDDGTATDNMFSIVSNETTTKVFFLGADPLMIDVVEMDTLDSWMLKIGVDVDDYDFGDSAVMITLPNAIEIQNVGSIKTYYAGTVNDTAGASNKMIEIRTTGGSTFISHADADWHNGTLFAAETSDTAYDLYDDVHAAAWTNTGSAAYNNGGPGDHTDQIGILITSHEDE